MKHIRNFEEFLNEAKNEAKYPSFQADKAIGYQDMLISVGYWTYMGREIRGKGLYKNVNNGQTYLFDADDIQYFKKHLDDIEVNEAVNEASSMNDPVLIAIRAAKMSREKSSAKQKEAMKKRVYGKKREALEDELVDIAEELKGLYSDKRNLFDDMESEAGQKGDDWTDDDANRYGQELNDVDDQIEELIKRRQEIEIKLTY